MFLENKLEPVCKDFDDGEWLASDVAETSESGVARVFEEHARDDDDGLDLDIPESSVMETCPECDGVGWECHWLGQELIPTE